MTRPINLGNTIVDVVLPAGKAQSWAEGTLPGGPGTKSAKEHAQDAAASAQDAADSVGDVTTAREQAQAAAAAAATDRTAVATDRAAVATELGTVTTLAVQVATNATNAANSAAAAQAIAFGSVIDAKGNITIGSGAVAPADVANQNDGNGVVLGTGAGVGLSQLYSRKPHAIGWKAMISYRGYAAVGIGAYAGARAVSDYGAFVGTHAAQDYTAPGRLLQGWGARATGSVTFSAAPSPGDTVTVNGVVLTVAASPANAYEFAPGASAAEAARNLLRCLTALTDTAILLGYYRMASSAATAVNVASTATGTAGNAFTLAASGASIAVSGATLTGGSNFANAGDPIPYTGDNGMGFGVMSGGSRPTTRRGRLAATMPSIPADGAVVRLGFNLTTAVTFRNSPSTALEIQIGATVAETLANLATGLNGSGNATITACTYWAQNGVLFIEHNSNNIHTFEVRSYTPALVFPHPSVRGGTNNGGPNNALGQFALLQSITANSVAFGTSSGSYSTGNNRVTFGANAGQSGNGRDVFVWGDSSLLYTSGDDIIALGRGISNGTQDAWLAITGIATDGTITFAAPHGWTDGNIYSLVWRDRASSGAQLQRTLSGTTSWANIPTSIGGLVVQVISGTQVRVLDGMPDADTGARYWDYRSTGTVANVDVARFTQRVSMSVSIGTSAIPRERTFTLGSSLYRNGLWVDAMGLWVRAGELRPPQIGVSGAWPNGFIQFATANGNFAADETVTINGTVFTAKAAATFATPNSSMIRWFRIGADMWESLSNLVECIRNSDDQSAAARLVNVGRFWISAQSGSGWRLNWQSYDSLAQITITSSKTGATVTSNAGTLTGLGNAAGINPPQDRGIVQLSVSPANNGNPGLAQYNLATDSWRLI